MCDQSLQKNILCQAETLYQYAMCAVFIARAVNGF